MDYNKARELLQKYWEGETGLEEEKQLRYFFSQNAELPADLENVRSLFGYFEAEGNRVATGDLAEKLKTHWKEYKQPPVKTTASWMQLIKYAAVLIPLLLIGYFLINRSEQEQVSVAKTGTDTYEDPKKAIAETEKALLLLSQNMNHGMATMETFKLFDEVRNSGKFKGQQNRPEKK